MIVGPVRPFFLCFATLLLSACACGQTGSQLARASVQHKIGSALTWASFWRHSDLEQATQLARKIKVKIVRLEPEWVVFISDLGIRLHFTVDNNGTLGRLLSVSRLSDVGEANNDEALASYIRIRIPDATECVNVLRSPGKRPLSQVQPGIPASRLCVEGGRPVLLYQEDGKFGPVDLSSETKVHESPPPEQLGQITRALRTLIADLFPRDKVVATIPLYSATDPEVYVLVETQTGVRGILPVIREANQGWSGGKFIYDSEKNNAKHLIGRIKSRSLMKVELP